MSMYDYFSEADIAILHERAARIATISDEGDASASMMGLVVWLGNDRYALPIEYIRTVHLNVPIVPMPSVNPSIRGVSNIRGHIIPVIDAGRLFIDQSSTDPPPKYYLIVIADGALTAALYVHRVGDIIEFSPDSLSPISLDTDKQPFVQGIAPSGETLLSISQLLPYIRKHSVSIS